MAKQGYEIDLTKIRGEVKFEAIIHTRKTGDKYFFIRAIFENGTSLLIDMQLIELLETKLHRAIRKDMGEKDISIDTMEEIMAFVSGKAVRDAILDSIYEEG